MKRVMHRLAPAVLTLLTLGFAACSGSDSSDAPKTGTAYGMSERTVRDARSKDFVAADDGVTYTLIRVEYGDTPECSAWDDTDCWYSTYCGFVVASQDYPLEVNWVTDADALFDPAMYCENGDLEGCELPGQTLPILEDDDFNSWMYDTDAAYYNLFDCFADYW